MRARIHEGFWNQLILRHSWSSTGARCLNFNIVLNDGMLFWSPACYYWCSFMVCVISNFGWLEKCGLGWCCVSSQFTNEGRRATQFECECNFRHQWMRIITLHHCCYLKLLWTLIFCNKHLNSCLLILVQPWRGEMKTEPRHLRFLLHSAYRTWPTQIVA